MPEFKRPSSEQEFERNFEQIKPAMNATEAYYESSRCLFCFDAPCTQACPTHIDIPLFIRQINSGNVTGAALTIYDANYFGHACGQVCPTEVLCEGACVYTNQNIKAIEIGRLQAYATHHHIKNDKPLFKLALEIDKKIAVIGAGPAGISAACELRRMGFHVEVFEAKARPSGLTIHGVAPYKITNQSVLDEMAYLESQFGFKVHYNSAIMTSQDFKKLESDFDAILLGIGLGATTGLRLPGENLNNCVGAVEFIEYLRLHHHKVKVGDKVIILGGGNTAMDAASESARMGASEVILCYRRGKEEMKAYEFEYELAKSVGVKAMFNVAPVEIVGSAKVEGVKFNRTSTVNGQVEPVKGSEFVEPCDMVIKATGQSKMTELLGEIAQLKLDSKNRIIVDPQTGQTSNPRYFAAGDGVNGGKEVVNAVAEGKIAAQGIAKYLSEKH